jgi:hypothetical protein
MTNAVGGLRGRLRQFDNTLNGKLQHGGADRFRFKYPIYSEIETNMYVSVQAFDCDVTSNRPKDLIIMGEVAKHEFTCFAKFVEEIGSLPKFNDKKSEKYSRNKDKQQLIAK